MLACRSPERGQAALNALKVEVPDAKAEVIALDLTSLASVERFATEFAKRYQRLDVLANNAGSWSSPTGRPRTASSGRSARTTWDTSP